MLQDNVGLGACACKGTAETYRVKPHLLLWANREETPTQIPMVCSPDLLMVVIPLIYRRDIAMQVCLNQALDVNVWGGAYNVSGPFNQR